MTGKHRLPRRSTGRNLAATAAVLTVGALPLAAAGNAFADAPPASLGLSSLPLGLGSVAQPLNGNAAMERQAAVSSANLATKTTQLTGRLNSVLPVTGLVQEVAPAAAGGPLQVAPTLLQDGAVGTLTDGFGGKAMQVTNGVVNQVQPMVQQLHSDGVPTVGEVTSTLSGTKMPVFGTIGGLTSALPVSDMLGDQSPVLGTVGAASGL